MKKKLCFLFVLFLMFTVSVPVTVNAQSFFPNEDAYTAFRRELYSHHVVVTLEWPDPRKPQVIQRSNGTLSIVAKVEDAKGAVFYGVTNFHVAAPDNKSIPAGVRILIGVLVVDERVVAQRFVFPGRLAAVDQVWDRILIQFSIPRNPSDLGENFIKRLEEDDFPTTYNYELLMSQVVPSRFSSATQPPVRGTPLWVVGFAGGRAPRVAELAMNFEDVPGRYQFQFGEFPIARVWMMDVVSGSVAGMSGGFVYNSSGLVVGLYHGHFSVQQVPVLATATPGPLVGGWVTRELEKLGVRL